MRLDSVPLFDELAEGYDELVPFFATFGRRLVELIDPPAGIDLLDVGAGRGAVAIPAAARGCRVVAVDAAPRMVRKLSMVHPELDARVMNADRLEFPDDSFGVATAAFVIHCVDDPAQVLAELTRVVRPGGLVVMTVPGACDDRGRWDRFNAIGTAYTPRPGVPQVARPTDVAALFVDAGLTELRQESIEVHLPVDSPERMWDFQMSHGFVGYVRSFSRDDQADFKRRALEELRQMRADGGIDLHRAAAVHLGRVPAQLATGPVTPA